MYKTHRRMQDLGIALTALNASPPPKKKDERQSKLVHFKVFF